MQIGDLKPNKRNPRKMSESKKEQLKEALEEFGDLGSIVFNRRSGTLVSAHQRTSVLPKNAKIEITEKFDPPSPTGTVAVGHVTIKGERFGYREVDWGPTKEMAAVIAANRHSGEWDHEILKAEVDQLFRSGYRMNVTGLDTDELDEMIAQAEKHAEQTQLMTASAFVAPRKEVVEKLDEQIEEKRAELTAVSEALNEKAAEAFGAVEETKEIQGKQHVIILNFATAESKDAFKQKLRTENLLLEYGGKIF